MYKFLISLFAISSLCLLPYFSLQAQNCFYKHLKGTIGKTSITMELHGKGILGYYEGDNYIEAETIMVNG